MAKVSKRRAAIVALAKEQYHRDGEVEVDDGAKLSEGDDNGCYVAAWVWVDFAGTEFDKEDDGERISTYCGSMTRAELTAHVKECGACGGDDNLLAEVDKGLSAQGALLAIQEAMDGVEWNSDTMEEVATIMVRAGYRVRDLNDTDVDGSGVQS